MCPPTTTERRNVSLFIWFIPHQIQIRTPQPSGRERADNNMLGAWVTTTHDGDNQPHGYLVQVMCCVGCLVNVKLRALCAIPRRGLLVFYNLINFSLVCNTPGSDSPSEVCFEMSIRSCGLFANDGERVYLVFVCLVLLVFICI